MLNGIYDSLSFKDSKKFTKHKNNLKVFFRQAYLPSDLKIPRGIILSQKNQRLYVEVNDVKVAAFICQFFSKDALSCSAVQKGLYENFILLFARFGFDRSGFLNDAEKEEIFLCCLVSLTQLT